MEQIGGNLLDDDLGTLLALTSEMLLSFGSGLWRESHRFSCLSSHQIGLAS